MRKWTGFFFTLALLLAGCLPGRQAMEEAMPEEEPVKAAAAMPHEGEQYLSDLGEAPELMNTTWLNTDQPLRLADLRGKVVLLEMWTLGCINCRNTIPSLKEWHDRYADLGLVIIGNHYPEFAYEADLGRLEEAVADLEIPYPVAQDNDGATWKAYHSRYWPTLFLIDKQGTIRYTRIGEGEYATTEKVIQALLAEASEKE